MGGEDPQICGQQKWGSPGDPSYTRGLDGIPDSMNMSLSKLQEIGKDREALKVSSEITLGVMGGFD